MSEPIDISKERERRKKDGTLELVRFSAGSKRGACLHATVLVTEDTLLVHCRSCGEQLNPAKVILEFARKERQFQWRTESLVSEQKKLAAEVDALKKERERLRHQVRRSKMKVTPDEERTA